MPFITASVDNRQLVEARVNLVHAYNVLIDALGRLASSGSEQASILWDAMPNAAPVGARTTLGRALQVARSQVPPLDALPEWQAYLTALADFADAPLFGPAPMPCPPGALAALDNGGVWVFQRGG